MVSDRVVRVAEVEVLAGDLARRERSGAIDVGIWAMAFLDRGSHS